MLLTMFDAYPNIETIRLNNYTPIPQPIPTLADIQHAIPHRHRLLKDYEIVKQGDLFWDANKNYWNEITNESFFGETKRTIAFVVRRNYHIARYIEIAPTQTPPNHRLLNNYDCLQEHDLMWLSTAGEWISVHPHFYDYSCSDLQHDGFYLFCCRPLEYDRILTDVFPLL
jgi:hypothetical protein